MRRERQQRVRDDSEIVASWGAALRTGTAGSQDESRCSPIHKQRPYQENSAPNAERSVRVNPADYFVEQVGDYRPQGGENGYANGDDAAERLGAEGSAAWSFGRYAGVLSTLTELRGEMPRAESVGEGAAVAALTLRTEVQARTLIAGILAAGGCDAVASG